MAKGTKNVPAGGRPTGSREGGLAFPQGRLKWAGVARMQTIVEPAGGVDERNHRVGERGPPRAVPMAATTGDLPRWVSDGGGRPGPPRGGHALPDVGATPLHATARPVGRPPLDVGRVEFHGLQRGELGRHEPNPAASPPITKKVSGKTMYPGAVIGVPDPGFSPGRQCHHPPLY